MMARYAAGHYVASGITSEPRRRRCRPRYRPSNTFTQSFYAIDALFNSQRPAHLHECLKRRHNGSNFARGFPAAACLSSSSTPHKTRATDIGGRQPPCRLVVADADQAKPAQRDGFADTRICLGAARAHFDKLNNYRCFCKRYCARASRRIAFRAIS